MINMNIDGDLKDLINDLRKLKKHIRSEEKWAIETLHKNISVIFERKIEDLVYDQYDPIEYQRTYHLKGGHGAKDETLNLSGATKSYDFSIDEDSRDPVDGTTWGKKADAIEHGASMMNFRAGVEPFNRPFILDTQNAIEWENMRTANEFERSVIDYINKVAKG